MRDNLFRKSYFFKWIIYGLNGQFPSQAKRLNIKGVLKIAKTQEELL